MNLKDYIKHNKITKFLVKYKSINIEINFI